MPVRNNPKTVCPTTSSSEELMGSCPLHPWPSRKDCEDGKLFGVLPLGDDRPATCPTHRDMERGFPPHVFWKRLTHRLLPNR